MKISSITVIHYMLYFPHLLSSVGEILCKISAPNAVELL
jgi:hypothetical protein